MKNSINWFEIPTRDMDKAVTFYEKTLGVTLQREVFGGEPHAMFPVEKDPTSVTGSLVTAKRLTPGATGVLIYLNAPDGVNACLARARAAGAKELAPQTPIGEHGFIAVIADLDGNQVGLHSMKE
ncbi:MAG: VOC family protein [Kofleriaceae bacterium]|nr:MAG: VOC family protein [Kofleriaceae bacterium]MBZ0233112.1 VOC family protein [Kofleriaceae bacterium]